MRLRLFLFLWLLLLGGYPASAQLPVGSTLRFKRLTTAEGLSENSTYCLHQDRRGFLWVGTQDGLNRYDGTGFRVFKADPLDSTLLDSGYILALDEDSTGTLWVGTGGGGLARYNPITEHFRVYRAAKGTGQGLPSDFVRAVLVDRRGRVWAGTENGLCRFDPRTGHFRTFRHAATPDEGTDLRRDAIRALAQTPDGRIWVGTGEGRLSWFDERRGTLITAWRPHPDDAAAADVGQRAVTALLADRNWRIWIGTEGDGLRAYQPATGRLRTYRPVANQPGSLPAPRVRSLLRDRSGTLWVGTSGGLCRFDDARETFRTVRHNPSFPTNGLPDNDVQALLQDRSGQLWVATESGMASFADQLGAFARVGGMPADVWAVLPDAAGHLLVGTETEGVLHVAPDADDPLAPLPDGPMAFQPGAGGLPTPFVRALCRDRRGNLWVGTQSAGLVRYDAGTNQPHAFRHIGRDTASLSDDFVRGLMEDRAGYLWVSTEGGLNRYDPLTGRFRVYRHDPARPNSLPSNFVRQAVEGRRGNLWVATGGGGLALLDPERKGAFTNFRHNPADARSLPSDFVRVMYQDRRGVLWLGTEGGGLCRLDDAHPPGRFTTWREADGLPSNVVYAIMEDAGGNLWLTTNKGIARFDPTRNNFRRYDMRDGLVRDEFNAGAFARAADGRFFFGGPGGLLGFHPDSLRINAQPPPVVLTGLRLFDQPVLLDSAIGVRRLLRLRPDQNFLTFEFAALNFHLPDKNQYAYRLLGLTDRWLLVGNRHEAPFTNLNPGEYVFQVKAANNDGVWNQVGTSIRLLIPPPWYRTWWFRLILVLGFFLLLWAAYRIRVNQLLTLEQVRHGIARDLHDDMGSTLSSISILSQLAGQHHQYGNSQQVTNLLTQIGESSGRMLDSMDDIVWAINPAHDSMEAVTVRMRIFASEVLEARGIDFTFTVSPEVLNLRLDMRARREFYLLFKEAVNNLAKYAECDQVDIDLSIQHRTLVLYVADNGIGFDPSAPARGGGNGLTNMRSRAAAIGAKITFDTAPGQGTRVTLSVPMK